jgi:chromosome segregation ATPase
MSARSRPKAADTTSAATLDEIADELYGLAPEEFTAARTAREKEARQARDQKLAAGIHHLAKPTVAAWLANQLARERPDEFQALPDLGAGLRQATERLVGDDLRQLSRQQHELVYALVEQAKQLARASGHPVSEATARGLEDTLYAALADEHAAEQLLAGRLTEPLERSGFGDWATTDARAPSHVAPARAPQRRQQRGEEQLRRAERDLAEAERALTKATKARDETQVKAADADQAAVAAQGEVEELRRQLDEASADASEADRHRRERAKTLQQAERAVSEAERRRADAQARRDQVTGMTSIKERR